MFSDFVSDFLLLYFGIDQFEKNVQKMGEKKRKDQRETGPSPITIMSS